MLILIAPEMAVESRNIVYVSIIEGSTPITPDIENPQKPKGNETHFDMQHPNYNPKTNSIQIYKTYAVSFIMSNLLSVLGQTYTKKIYAEQEFKRIISLIGEP